MRTNRPESDRTGGIHGRGYGSFKNPLPTGRSMTKKRQKGRALKGVRIPTTDPEKESYGQNIPRTNKKALPKEERGQGDNEHPRPCQPNRYKSECTFWEGVRGELAREVTPKGSNDRKFKA